MNMTRKVSYLAVLGLISALNLGGSAYAGPIWDWICCNDCPKSSYSCLHFWAPTVSRANDCIHGPTIDVCAPDRHPEIEPTVTILRYACPPAAPASTIIPLPSAPATSLSKYLDRSAFGEATKDSSNPNKENASSSLPTPPKKNEEGSKDSGDKPDSKKPTTDNKDVDPKLEPKKTESNSKSEQQKDGNK